MSMAGSLLKCSKGDQSKSTETPKRYEKRILMMSMTREYRDVEGGDRAYPLFEFHLLDPETNEIQFNYLPSLLNVSVEGVMVASDNAVYLLGGLYPFVVGGSHFKLLKSKSPKSEEKFYLGGSRFDLGQQSEGGVWGPVPPSINHFVSSLYAALFGKIYALGSGIFVPEVYDPTVGNWRTLCVAPPDSDDAALSAGLLSDPRNKRILVHFYHPKPSLYAFTPPTDVAGSGTWECLASNFPYWSHVAAVVDGVLFLYVNDFPSCLIVFDIARRKWLNVCWTESFDNGINMNEGRIEFDALLPLSDKILCLAVSSPYFDPDIPKRLTDVQVTFAKFKVDLVGDTVNLIPLSTHTHLLPNTHKVSQYLLV